MEFYYFLLQIRRDEISNGFDAVTVGNVGLLRPASVEDRVVRNGINEEKLLQLCNIMEANETDHFQESQRVDRSASPAQNKGENLRSSFGEVGTSFFNMTKLPVKCQPSVGSITYSKLDTSRPHLELKDMQESLSQPSLNITLGVPLGTPNFVVPFSGSAAEEDEKSILPFQPGQRSRPIFPKPLKTGTTVSSETRKGMTPLVRIARPPAEGRGKNQLLPRYWPRITDQELEQLSGEYPFYFQFCCCSLIVLMASSCSITLLLSLTYYSNLSCTLTCFKFEFYYCSTL